MTISLLSFVLLRTLDLGKWDDPDRVRFSGSAGADGAVADVFDYGALSELSPSAACETVRKSRVRAWLCGMGELCALRCRCQVAKFGRAWCAVAESDLCPPRNSADRLL